MAKQYKAGQLITINRRVYRITKNINYVNNICNICHGCFFEHIFTRDRHNICWSICIRKLPSYCYLKLVKICGNLDKS